MEYDVVVTDQEYEEAKNFVTTQCRYAQKFINNYCQCLDKIVTEAIVSGEVNEALKEFQKNVQKLREVNELIGEKYSEFCKKFVSEIDSADRELYESGFNTVRKYDNQEKEKLTKVLKKNQCFYERMNRFLTFETAKALSGHWDVAERAFKNMKKEEKLYNQWREKGVESIFNEVVDVDKKYSVLFRDSVRGEQGHPGLNLISSTINSEIAVVREMTSLLNGGTEKFTVEKIALTLSPLFEQLNADLKYVGTIVETNTVLTMEELKKFVSFNENETFYKDYETIFEREYSSRDWSDEALNLLFNGDEVLNLIYSNNIYIPEEIKGNPSKIYDFIIIRKQLIKMVNEVVGNETYNEMFTSKFLKAYNEEKGVQAYKWNSKLNEAFYDKSLGNDTGGFAKYSSELKEFNAYYGETLKALKGVSNVEEVIEPLFYNYVKNVGLLRSVSGNIEEGSMSSIVLESLIQEYKNKYLLAGKNLIKEINETGYGIATDAIWKKVLSSETLTVVALTKDIYFSLTGYDTAYESLREFKALYSTNDSLIKNYKANFQLVRDSGDNVTEEQRNNLQYSFELLKGTYIKELDDLTVYYESTSDVAKTQYYREMSRRMKKLQLSENNLLNDSFLSYEEWISEK